MPEWVMDPLTGNMMQRGVGAAQQVVKSELADIDTLSREAGQNSLDQKTSEKNAVKVRYTVVELSGKHKSDFLKSMDWADLREHLEACTSDPGATGPRLRRGVNAIESDAPLRCLRIEDFGTRGCRAPTSTPKTKIRIFNCSVGPSSKLRMKKAAAEAMGSEKPYSGGRQESPPFSSLPSLTDGRARA